MYTPRRQVLQALATVGVISTAGCASIVNQTSDAGAPSGGDEPATPESTEVAQSGADDSSTAEEPETTEDVRIDSPQETFSSVPIPSAETAYPRMGVDDAPTVTLVGNWKCPYTRDFVLDQFPAIVDEYVRSGDVSVEVRMLAFLDGEPFLGPDAPNATRAGLSVWETDRDNFWQYLSYVFANQPPERRNWAQSELLVRFGEAADVAKPDQIEQAISQEAFSDQVEQTVTFARSTDVTTVPRVLSEDEKTAPTVNPDQTLAQLDRVSDR